MKASIIIPTVAGILGFVGARVSGIESGALQLGIGVGCMIIGAGVLFWRRRRGG